MDPLLVFLVPLGGQRYELYCERHHTGPDEAPAGGGWFAGLRQKFSTMLQQAEEEEAAPPSAGLWARLQARMMAWVAERVAEQRLLWRLRGKAHVVASHPDDVSFETILPVRSEERRVGKECRSRWSPYH